MPDNTNINPPVHFDNLESMDGVSADTSASKARSIEDNVRDILVLKLASLVEGTSEDSKVLKEIYGEITELTALVAKINAMTDKDGKITVDQELFDMLNGTLKGDSLTDAQNDLKIAPEGLKILEVGKVYKGEDRQRLLENLNNHVQNLHSKADRQFLDVNFGYQLKLEVQQLAQKLMNDLNAMNKGTIRGISGR